MPSEDRSREIIERKRRASRQHSFFSFEIETLQRQWTNTRERADFVPDFFVIRLVTVLEVFARHNLAELIDHGKEYTDRAVDLSKQFKIDFGLVRDIQGRVITLGDIVAHNVSLNSFAQLVGCFETIFGRPLRPLLSAAIDRWAVEVEKKASKPIIADFDSTAKRIGRLFEVRHIAVHELPTESIYNENELAEFFEAVIEFTKAMEELLTAEKFGLVPLTQSAMNIAAGESLKKAEEELDQLESEIQQRVRETGQRIPEEGENKDEWLECFNDSAQKWIAFRNAHCEFLTFLHRGGTIRPLLWGNEAERLTKLRVDDLQKWIELNRAR